MTNAMQRVREYLDDPEVTDIVIRGNKIRIRRSWQLEWVTPLASKAVTRALARTICDEAGAVYAADRLAQEIHWPTPEIWGFVYHETLPDMDGEPMITLHKPLVADALTPLLVDPTISEILIQDTHVLVLRDGHTETMPLTFSADETVAVAQALCFRATGSGYSSDHPDQTFPWRASDTHVQVVHDSVSGCAGPIIRIQTGDFMRRPWQLALDQGSTD